MQGLIINSTLQCTLLLFIPFLFAYILKQTKIRSWAMIGGVIGGILLGPAIFGSVAHDYWEDLFKGGSAQHKQVIQLERQQHADILAATTLGVDEIIRMQMRAEQQYDLKLAGDAWDKAQWDSQQTLRDYAILLIICILLGGSMRCSAKGTAPHAMSLSVGVWAVIVPSGITSLLLLLFTEMNVTEVLALGACLGAGPWTLASWEQRVANKSERNGALLMLRCGRVAWIGAGIIAIYAAWQVRGAMALVWMLPLLLLPVIWIVPRKKWRWLEAFVDYAAIPSVMATSIVLINPLEHLEFWPIVLVLLFCADARWLGGIIGLGLLGGRKSGDAMRLSIPLVDAGVSQLCLAALLIGVGALPPSFAIAALLGAVFLEYTAPIRMKMATLNVEHN